MSSAVWRALHALHIGMCCDAHDCGSGSTAGMGCYVPGAIGQWQVHAHQRLGALAGEGTCANQCAVAQHSCYADEDGSATSCGTPQGVTTLVEQAQPPHLFAGLAREE
jgi:hypothetical protein